MKFKKSHPVQPGKESPAPVAVQKSSLGAAPATFAAPRMLPDLPYDPSHEMWNLTDSVPGHPKGSSVSRKTLEDMGYTVPPMPKTVARQDKEGNTHIYNPADVAAILSGEKLMLGDVGIAPNLPPAKPEPVECCGSCRYRLADDRCHAGLPQVQYPYTRQHILWPVVPFDEWCGSYKRKEAVL